MVSLLRDFSANLSLHDVNSMNCMVKFGVGAMGGKLLYKWPFMQSMLSLSLVEELWAPWVLDVAMVVLCYIEVINYGFQHSLVCSATIFCLVL